MIPDRERGYSVELDTLIVHERYQDHAPRAMRTTALGVTNIALQRGMEPVPCEACFPPPPPVRASRRKAPESRDGMVWVDDANGGRWVTTEDVEDAPYTAAIVASMLQGEEVKAETVTVTSDTEA